MPEDTDTSLKFIITAEIAERGPMPFERFMELSLYHPKGFFGGDQLRSQRGGDFLTSPEVSPIFGETLARFVSAERDRIGEPFRVVEVGAGSGSLLRPLLDAIEVPATVVEASPAARASLATLSPDVEVRTDLPDKVRGVVIANELLDNLPMALAQRVDGEWRERWVGRDGDDLGFVDAPVRPEVAEWLRRHGAEVGLRHLLPDQDAAVADVVAERFRQTEQRARHASLHRQEARRRQRVVGVA